MNFVEKDGTTKVYVPVHPWEKRKQRTGVQFILGDLKTPHTYRLSYVIYLKDC